MKLKIKVCGMKYPENLSAVSALSPDYLGFILYPPSSRFMPESLNPEHVKAIKDIQKVGVFVNATEGEVETFSEKYAFDLLQLHGNESPEFCQVFKEKGYGIIKVFSIGQNFDFTQLNPYKNHVDYFLFDTKGKLPGGNGKTFDWQVLQHYPLAIPYFLSGGIGPKEYKDLALLSDSRMVAIDINSQFEQAPGQKDISLLKAFFAHLSQLNAQKNEY